MKNKIKCRNKHKQKSKETVSFTRNKWLEILARNKYPFSKHGK